MLLLPYTASSVHEAQSVRSLFESTICVVADSFQQRRERVVEVISMLLIAIQPTLCLTKPSVVAKTIAEHVQFWNWALRRHRSSKCQRTEPENIVLRRIADDLLHFFRRVLVLAPRYRTLIICTNRCRVRSKAVVAALLVRLLPRRPPALWGDSPWTLCNSGLEHTRANYRLTSIAPKRLYFVTKTLRDSRSRILLVKNE